MDAPNGYPVGNAVVIGKGSNRSGCHITRKEVVFSYMPLGSLTGIAPEKLPGPKGYRKDRLPIPPF